MSNRPKPERLRRGYRGIKAALQVGANGVSPGVGKGEKVHVACTGHEVWQDPARLAHCGGGKGSPAMGETHSQMGMADR
jgi:hypothetical protein